MAWFDENIARVIAYWMGSSYNALEFRASCRTARAALAPPAYFACAEGAMYAAAFAGDIESCTIARDRAIAQFARELRIDNRAIAQWWTSRAIQCIMEQCVAGGHPTLVAKFRAWCPDVSDITAAQCVVRGLLCGGFYDLALRAHLDAEGAGEPLFVAKNAELIGGSVSLAHIREIFARCVADRGTISRAIITKHMVDGAVRCNRVDVAEFLLEESRDFDIDDGWLQTAMTHGNIGLCRMIDARIPQARASTIGYAARSGSREMCEFARKRADIFAIDMMMYGAIIGDHPAICKLARRWLRNTTDHKESVDYGYHFRGIKAENYDAWCVHCPRYYANDAAEHGSLNAFRLMVEWGADNFDKTLATAINVGSYCIIREILDHHRVKVDISRAIQATRWDDRIIQIMLRDAR